MGPGSYAPEEHIIPDSLSYPHYMRETLRGGADPFLSLKGILRLQRVEFVRSEWPGSIPVIESVGVRVHPCAGLLNFLEALCPTLATPPSSPPPPAPPPQSGPEVWPHGGTRQRFLGLQWGQAPRACL